MGRKAKKPSPSQQTSTKPLALSQPALTEAPATPSLLLAQEEAQQQHTLSVDATSGDDAHTTEMTLTHTSTEGASVSVSVSGPVSVCEHVCESVSVCEHVCEPVSGCESTSPLIEYAETYPAIAEREEDIDFYVPHKLGYVSQPQRECVRECEPVRERVSVCESESDIAELSHTAQTTLTTLTTHTTHTRQLSLGEIYPAALEESVEQREGEQELLSLCRSLMHSLRNEEREKEKAEEDNEPVLSSPVNTDTQTHAHTETHEDSSSSSHIHIATDPLTLAHTHVDAHTAGTHTELFTPQTHSATTKKRRHSLGHFAISPESVRAQLIEKRGLSLVVQHALERAIRREATRAVSIAWLCACALLSGQREDKRMCEEIDRDRDGETEKEIERDLQRAWPWILRVSFYFFSLSLSVSLWLLFLPLRWGESLLHLVYTALSFVTVLLLSVGEKGKERGGEVRLPAALLQGRAVQAF